MMTDERRCKEDAKKTKHSSMILSVSRRDEKKKNCIKEEKVQRSKKSRISTASWTRGRNWRWTDREREIMGDTSRFLVKSKKEEEHVICLFVYFFLHLITSRLRVEIILEEGKEQEQEQEEWERKTSTNEILQFSNGVVSSLHVWQKQQVSPLSLLSLSPLYFSFYQEQSISEWSLFCYQSCISLLFSSSHDCW